MDELSCGDSKHQDWKQSTSEAAEFWDEQVTLKGYF